MVYAEGKEEVVLRAVQNVIDDGLAVPILIASPEVLAMRLEKLGLRMCPGRDVEVVNPHDDPRFREYWELYHRKLRRRGITPDIAKTMVRTRNSVIAALMVERGEADATISGVVGRFQHSIQHVIDVPGAQRWCSSGFFDVCHRDPEKADFHLRYPGQPEPERRGHCRINLDGGTTRT